MKTSNHTFICILICLVPALLAGQALQVQNQQPGISSPLKDLSGTSFRMTDPPLLRLSHEGPPGLEMVKIELIPLSLQSTGPILLLNQQDPMMPGDGSISLLPNYGGSPFSIRNIGSSGQDGVQLNIVCPPVHNSFFDVFYDLPLGKETHTYGDPDFDLLRITTYDKATPKLQERISSNNPGMNSFFDVFYDLSQAKETHAYGDPDFDLLRITTYDKATPKLLERVTSNSIGLDSFFDVFYDLSLATTGIGFGFEPNDICMVHKFENDPPRLHTKVQTSNPLFVDSFFDITYDLDLGSIKTEHNQNAFTVTSSEPSTICWKFESMLPATPQFFDICYDMNLRQHKITLEDLIVTRTFDSATPKLTDRIQSALLPYLESFFDITYDLEERAHKIILEDLIVSDFYFPETPKLQQTISSLDPGMLDHFFDITYDLALGIQSTKHRGLVYAVQYRESDWDFSSRISSEDPTVPGFFDITYDIGLGDLLSHSTRAGTQGTAPIEMRYEYDALNRKIRQVGTDMQNGSTLSLDWLLSPSGSTLKVSNKLEVQGAISSPAGPLQIQDDLMLIGAAHQVNGNVTINGNFQVNGIKMFKIDHPLDPEYKYLQHSCVESPDMMNIYNGNIITDESGYAIIHLPGYFEALNMDFRYQLTCIGQFAQAIIDQKIKDNQFVIRTDKPNVEVSWQVTGIRHDDTALNSGYAVEVTKAVVME